MLAASRGATCCRTSRTGWAAGPWCWPWSACWWGRRCGRWERTPRTTTRPLPAGAPCWCQAWRPCSSGLPPAWSTSSSTPGRGSIERAWAPGVFTWPSRRRHRLPDRVRCGRLRCQRRCRHRVRRGRPLGGRRRTVVVGPGGHCAQRLDRPPGGGGVVRCPAAGDDGSGGGGGPAAALLRHRPGRGAPVTGAAGPGVLRAPPRRFGAHRHGGRRGAQRLGRHRRVFRPAARRGRYGDEGAAGAGGLLPRGRGGVDPGVPAFVIFIAGIVVAAATLVLWLELVVRAAAVSAAVLFLPLVLAAAVWP